MTSWWGPAGGDGLAQGDWLRGCLVPVVAEDFDTRVDPATPSDVADLIVMTHSCDLANGKATSVVLCPATPLQVRQRLEPTFPRGKALEQIRQGRVAALHLLANPDTPADNQTALVVDFRKLITLPLGYLQRHAATLGPRHRLNSPYLEHLSQSFACFFMRVGLPADIPPYTN